MSARRWGPPAVWAALMLVLTSLPGSALPQVDGRGLDKLVHLTLYAILGWLATRATEARGVRAWRRALAIVAGIALFAAADEWHQQFIPGRSMELLDWISDTAGAALGAAARVAMTTAALRREHRA